MENIEKIIKRLEKHVRAHKTIANKFKELGNTEMAQKYKDIAKGIEISIILIKNLSDE